MKINWYLVAVIVVAVAAAVGWYQYLGERERYQNLLSQQPTPPPTGTIFGVLEKVDGDLIYVGILEAAGEQGTLVSTPYRLSANASVLRLDMAANEYVSARMSSVEPGTWLQLGVDADGVVISVTAGR